MEESWHFNNPTTLSLPFSHAYPNAATLAILLQACSTVINVSVTISSAMVGNLLPMIRSVQVVALGILLKIVVEEAGIRFTLITRISSCIRYQHLRRVI
jgi:hypothetical protein